MTSRLLLASEWDRLAETGLALPIWRDADRDALQIVIVEDGPQIVACWATLACRHVEGFWIAPAHRKRGSVLRRLAFGMRDLLQKLGATTVLTYAETPEVEALLEQAGATVIPMKSYSLPANFFAWRRKESEMSCR